MKTFHPEEHKAASGGVGQTGKASTTSRSYYEGSRRRASHPPLERRPRLQRPTRRRGQVSGGAQSDLWTAPPSGMSSPSVSVLSMASLGSSVAGGPPNLPLNADKGGRGCDGDAEGGGGGGGGVRRSSDGGGGASDVTPRNSVYSSTSYAASRGFRPQAGDHSLPHPVAPPRSRGTIVTPPARGIKKSSSEIMGRGSGPARGILKSSSGVLKSHQHTEVPLSKSSSGITAPLPPRVNFNTTVVTSDDPPPPAAATPTPSKPPSETHTTGMFVAPVPSCVASAVPVVMSLSASGTSEAAVPVAADPASLCTVASVVTSPASPPASSHASAVPVTTTTGVTSLLTSRSLASPPVAPPRRRRAAARGEYCLCTVLFLGAGIRGVGGSCKCLIIGVYLRGRHEASVWWWRAARTVSDAPCVAAFTRVP
ncbi:proline-rich protein 36-like isoform X1 [Scylla paramamosain]|uniref:proline-rich protein 36-like isoform X1 n=1 Tax=Scylla paramamosain TaxID=85552 RepID=UPI00308308CF